MDKCDKWDFDPRHIGNVSSIKFPIGTTVNKKQGYVFPGTVVSVFQTLEGHTRYVVEMKIYHILHIFNEEQLMAVDI